MKAGIRSFDRAYGIAMAKLADDRNWVKGWSAEKDRAVYEKALRDPNLGKLDEKKVKRLQDFTNRMALIGIPSSAALAGLGIAMKEPVTGGVGGVLLAGNLAGQYLARRRINRYKNDEKFRREDNLVEKLSRNPREEGLQTYIDEHY